MVGTLATFAYRFTPNLAFKFDCYRLAATIQKQAISGIIGFVGVGIAEFVDELVELPPFCCRYLDADQHPAMIGAVIAIVEETDIPIVRHASQELQQLSLIHS